MADLLLKLEDLNVIPLNWGDISVGLYTKVVFNMYRAGNGQNYRPLMYMNLREKHFSAFRSFLSFAFCL